MATVNNFEGGTGGGNADAIVHERINSLQADHVELKTSIARQFDSVHSAISAIATEIKDKGKIQWPALTLMLGFVTTLGGLVIYPVKDTQGRMEHAIEVIADKMVTEKELTGTLGAIKERRDDQQRVTEARFVRDEGEIDALQRSVVPRGELEANWAAQRSRDSEIQRQLDEQRTRVEGIYSPRDAIASLQRTVEDLQARLTGRKG